MLVYGLQWLANIKTPFGQCVLFMEVFPVLNIVQHSRINILITYSYSYTYKIIIMVLSYCIDQIKATQSDQNH